MQAAVRGFAHHILFLGSYLTSAHMPRSLPITDRDRARHALALLGEGQLKPAERLLKDVLKSDPAQFEALLGSGVLAGMRGDDLTAVRFLTRAGRRNPQSEEAHYNLGQALIRLGRFQEAAEAITAALKIAEQPQFHEKLGDCLRQLGRLEEAATHFVRAVDLEPANPLALSSAVETLRKICAWDRIGELQVKLVAAAAAGRPVEPLTLLHVADDPTLQRKAAEAYWRGLVRPATSPVRLRRRASAQKLGIGYLSADFRRHPMVSVIAEVIELHDRSRFDVWGLSYGPDDGSPQRQRMAAAFDRFVDLSGVASAQMITRIADSGIDILVDLAGYTANARLDVVAARPAPIVCHYMGYPGTLGSGAVYDYLLADAIVAPPAEEPAFAEALARLPGCYWAVDSKRDSAVVPTSRREHGLPDDACVLSSFNGQQKLSPALLDVWARILITVPRAVLWLYSDTPAAAVNLRREIGARGIPHERCIMAGRVTPEAHLARVALADLMLDAQPYGGHTTVCDALWMGVPALTLTGRSFASRVGESLLTHAGLPELVAASLDDYEHKAIALAREPERLARLRAHLVAARSTAPLFDTAAFTRGLETAFEHIWARHERGESPATFDVAALASGEGGAT